MRQTQPPAVRGGGESYLDLSPLDGTPAGAPSPWESGVDCRPCSLPEDRPRQPPRLVPRAAHGFAGCNPAPRGWPVSHRTGGLQRRQASSLRPAGSRAGAGPCRSPCALQGQARAGSNRRYKAAGTSPLVARGGGGGRAGTCLVNPGTRRLHQSLFCLYGTQSLAPTLLVL